jgi:CubicO group peptidase (beta-lactamase class C family)
LATAAAILQLRDAGKLSLDDEIMAAASALLPKPTWRSSS